MPDGGTPIRVVVADHHTMVAEAFHSALMSEPDIEVVGTADTASAAVAVIGSDGGDIVVVADEDLPDGVEGPAAWILKHAPDARLVLLAERADPMAVQAAVDAGCVGYLKKTEDLQRLKDVVRAVATGHLAIPVDALRSLFELRLSSLTVTTRELQILRLAADGLSNQGISQRLGIQLNTVRTHLQRTIKKLDAHSKLEAVARARQEGLLGP